MEKEQKTTFEEKMARLEQLTRQLSAQNASLQDSLRLYADGMKLARELEGELAEGERLLEQISPETLEITPFGAENQEE